MGMDVYGKNPTAEVGSYFRSNIWWWSPLWDFCREVAPELTNKVKRAYTNDGDGLDAEDSRLLAQALRTAIETGKAQQVEDEHRRQNMNIPKVNCDLCHGTGIRDDAIGQSLGFPNMVITKDIYGVNENHPRYGQKGYCNGCTGTGKRLAYDPIPFSVQNVKEFAEFLEHCGGFHIF